MGSRAVSRRGQSTTPPLSKIRGGPPGFYKVISIEVLVIEGALPKKAVSKIVTELCTNRSLGFYYPANQVTLLTLNHNVR